MRDLSSSGVAPIGPGDHVRGEGPEAIIFFDLACPACALAWQRLAAVEIRLCFRHFPLRSQRPRAPFLHAAAEAAAAQRPDGFFAMVDAIYADHSHLDDPHLWARAEALGLDLARFEGDRHSAEVAQRIARDFDAGIRAGVAGTPTAIIDGELISERVAERLADLGEQKRHL